MTSQNANLKTREGQAIGRTQQEGKCCLKWAQRHLVGSEALKGQSDLCFKRPKLGAKVAHYCVLAEPKCLINNCGANPCQHTCTAALRECEESSDSPNTFFGGGGVSGGHLSAAQPLASMSSGGRLRGGPPQAAGPRSLRGGQRDSGHTVTS